MFPDRTQLSKPPARDDVISIAREWVGTPYQHQAMLRGVGVDCVGLIIAVGREAGVLPVTDEEISRFSGYGRLPNPRRMGQLMQQYLLPGEWRVPGDICWIQWRQGLPMHLAIMTGDNTLIHAFGDVRKVCEHRITPLWIERIVSFWRYPGFA